MSASVNTIAGNVLLVSSCVICQLTYAQSKTVTITDPRPVAEAVEKLENIYGWPITYEDLIVVNESRLEDVTERVQKVPDHTHPLIIQKEAAIAFTYRPPSRAVNPREEASPAYSETEAAVAEALTSVLTGYAASGGPETFNVTEEDGIFHLVPNNFLNKEGVLQNATPILDTRITVPPKQRTRTDLFHEICQSLSKATGVHVGEGTFPNQGSESDTLTEISGSNVTAHVILIKLLSELSTPVYRDLTFRGADGQMVTQHSLVWNGGPMSWEMFYSPGWGYVLNIYAVTVESK
jgi:hypothetical protein